MTNQPTGKSTIKKAEDRTAGMVELKKAAASPEIKANSVGFWIALCVYSLWLSGLAYLAFS